MIAKTTVLAVALFSSSFALAASPAIGSVSAPGEFQVGGYTVRGTATLFDNTAIQTNGFIATLRLDKGTQIRLGAESSGTLYRNRMVLSRGETELTASTPFQLEASGLHVSPTAPNTRGVVSVSGANTVEVAALRGELNVMNSRGAVLAHVVPGSTFSFAAGSSAQDASTSFSDIGLVSEENGQYYVTSSLTGVKYQVTGGNLSKYVGDKVVINGSLTSGTAAHPVTVSISSIAINGGGAVGGGLGTGGTVAIIGSLAGEGAALGYLVASASR